MQTKSASICGCIFCTVCTGDAVCNIEVSASCAFLYRVCLRHPMRLRADCAGVPCAL